jgi:3-methyladenine DNA glycosylase AlkD
MIALAVQGNMNSVNAITVRDVRQKLRNLGNNERAQVLQGFFKTGPGEYGEGDVFLGIRVPQLRKLAKEYQDMEITDVRELLMSPIHEERLFSLFILIPAFSGGSESEKKRIYDFYIKNTRFINNWDLVDLSAEHIVGAFLMDKSKGPLYKLAKSTLLWNRRISIISTFHYIKRNHFSVTLKIARMLIRDKEDLIHKAVGWMLREIGKRDQPTEEIFLKEQYRKMPRTMLRYAIERFPEPKRKRYLKGTI